MNWKTASIGAVLASAIGVVIVAVGMQPFEGSEFRGVLTTMAIVCYLGCLPALLTPLLWMAYRRRPNGRAFLKATTLAGAVFPFALAAVVFVAPWLLTMVGLTEAARDFQGELDLDDATTWLVLLPAALLVGTLISRLVLRPSRPTPIQRDCDSEVE